MFFPAKPGNYGCIIKLFVVSDTPVVIFFKAVLQTWKTS